MNLETSNQISKQLSKHQTTCINTLRSMRLTSKYLLIRPRAAKYTRRNQNISFNSADTAFLERKTIIELKINNDGKRWQDTLVTIRSLGKRLLLIKSP